MKETGTMGEYAMQVPPSMVMGGTPVDVEWLEAEWRRLADRDGYEPTGAPWVERSELEPMLRDAPEFVGTPHVTFLVIGPARRLTDEELRARNDMRVHITPPHRSG